MTSRYLIDIENRKSKIIHVYRNGDKYNGAALVLLRPIEQQKLERIFKAIEEKITLPYNKPIKKIYTLKGKEIEDPIYVKDQKYYVVGSSESFINTKYGSIYKWAIIGPVRWSKFADVFYEPPESDDIGQRAAFQWRSTTTNSARMSSKMTKSMSAYPAEQKVQRNSKIMARSFDQSKRAVSEPSNDKKEENKNRNGDNAYFRSPDDKYSSGDNSDGSPKIISTQSQRSMNQFLNDSLKMYQMKDQPNADIESKSQKEDNNETGSEPGYLTNLDENKLESDQPNDDNICDQNDNNSEEKDSNENMENNNINMETFPRVHSNEDKQDESGEETVETDLKTNKNKFEPECHSSDEEIKQESTEVDENENCVIKLNEKQNSINEDVNILTDEIKNMNSKMSNQSDELEEPSIQEKETPNDVFTDDKLGFSLDNRYREEKNESDSITEDGSENENSMKEKDVDNDLLHYKDDEDHVEDDSRVESNFMKNYPKDIDYIQEMSENEIEDSTKNEVMDSVEDNVYSDKEEADNRSESRDTNKSNESNKIEVVSDLENEDEISQNDEDSPSKPEIKTEVSLKDEVNHTDFSNEEENPNQESIQKDEKVSSYQDEENSESDEENKSNKSPFGNTFDRKKLNNSMNNDQWDGIQYVSQPSAKDHGFNDFKDSADSRHENETMEDPNLELKQAEHKFTDLSKDKKLSESDSENDKEEAVSEISNPGNEIRELGENSYIKEPEPNSEEINNNDEDEKDNSSNNVSKENLDKQRESVSENDRETEESDHEAESMIEYEKNEHKFKEKEIYDKSLPDRYFKTDSDTEDYDDSKISVIDSSKDEEKKITSVEEHLKENEEIDEDNYDLDSKPENEEECDNYEEKSKGNQEEDNEITAPVSDIVEDSLAELSNFKDNSELLEENKEIIPKDDLDNDVQYSLDSTPNNSININNRSIEQYNRVDMKLEEPDHFVNDEDKQIADISSNINQEFIKDSNDSNQSPDNDIKEENAAKIIQKNFRGHLVRKELTDPSKDIDNDESEGEQHRSYDEHDSDDNENDPEINYSTMKDATNDLITDEILDEHSPNNTNCPEDIFTLNK